MNDVSTPIAPVPRISIQAFCEQTDTHHIMSAAQADRRMSKCHMKIHMGGAAAAVDAYRDAPTPNLIVIESSGEKSVLIEQLEELSNLCDSGTKVIVIGRVNDILLYRELIARGISEYIVHPFNSASFVRSVSELYAAPGSRLVGRVIAVTGSKGGVGASTVAHNLAWTMARTLDQPTVIVDMDLPFGTAGLDFNQDPPQGIADAIFANDRLDANYVERLMSRCSDKLSIMAAPATLDRQYDLGEDAFEQVIDLLRGTAPFIVLDVPHGWSGWKRRTLVSADDVLLVAGPDLASLRNAKNIFDALKPARANDSRPKILMNGVGMLKRPEISVSDFARAIEVELTGIIPHDTKLFGTAANNGQMIGEIDQSSKIAESFVDLVRSMTGRSEVRRAKKNMFTPLMAKLGRKSAS
ncbi:MAG: 4Fe-4S iron sulfur cluster binding s, NifH/frxC family protein [Hyphomicrobiales bacterium]|nr:4Fe-4S iron sulfur cluster binding s, NifH/frxC family protein [Hyphomicrobiales bacterium]